MQNPEDIIDLRSDTVSQPTDNMWKAMAGANVGDDVYGEDPTINQLEALAAQKTGKEAGLYVPSGTMGNLAAVLSFCDRGDEVILGNLSHTFLFEAGGIAALGGVHPYPIQNQPDGTMALADIRSAIRRDDPHFPQSKLIVLENTHNRCGGKALTLEYTHQVARLAKEHDLCLHIDGARIFNAAVALNVAVSELVQPADSITFCLSKALCAPVGSVLCGSGEFINRARRIRKQLGGGMRQAGVIAAAGIVALEEMVDGLERDHERAKELADGLSNIEGLSVDGGMPQTNMVFVSIAEEVGKTAQTIADKLKENGVKVGVVSSQRIRMVTHHWITDTCIEKTIASYQRILR